MGEASLEGFRIGVTAARKVEEQITLLERRGATVTWGPALSTAPDRVDDDELRAATADVLARPVEVLLATTGVGMRAWFDAAREWGRHEELVEALGRAEILARGSKSVGALRRNGLTERWSAASERFADVLDHLAGRDLTGVRVVVQEHGQSLSGAVQALRDRGADVRAVTIYRIAPAEDPGPVIALVGAIADRGLDAVTFTSAPAVAALLDAAASVGRRDEVLAAFRSDVLACCVGPVTSEAFEVWEVPTVFPDRSRTAAMVRLLETALPERARSR